MTYGYNSTLFVGFKQAKALGLAMIKGSKATWLRLGGNGKEKKRLIPPLARRQSSPLGSASG